MADELSWININDDSFLPSREFASAYSISTLVITTCSLTHILAEENLETTVPNRLHDTLAQNDLLYQRIHIYRRKSQHLPHACYSRRHAYHLTFPRFPVQRRWSELALPTFMTETKVKNVQEVNEKTSKGFPKIQLP